MVDIEKEQSAAGELIVVLGAGESGTGAAILARKQGYNVLVSDVGEITAKYREVLLERGIEFEEGHHSEERIMKAKEVIKSPGIPEKAPLVKKLRTAGIPVISEIEFAGRFTNAKTICITGSNGKTTTTSLTWHMLSKAGLNVGLAGNIGKSFAWQVAEADYDVYVLELSSFMLDDMYEFRADIAVLLNITPDHLDRYDYKMENYARSKFRIAQNQRPDDVFIYCADDAETLKYLDEMKINAQLLPFSIERSLERGAWLESEKIIINTNTTEVLTMSINELVLQGRHNIYNSMASGITAKVLDLRNDTIRESMGDFKNVPHRLENAGTISGITFINDSKATNVNSTWYALESVNTDVVLIMGGVDKGNDYSMLKELVKKKVKAIICLGKDNRRIYDAFEDDVEIFVNAFSAREAVEIGYHLATKGDTVLLSPACASFDLFKSYEDRGEQFKEAVKSL